VLQEDNFFVSLEILEEEGNKRSLSQPFLLQASARVLIFQTRNTIDWEGDVEGVLEIRIGETSSGRILGKIFPIIWEEQFVYAFFTDQDLLLARFFSKVFYLLPHKRLYEITTNLCLEKRELNSEIFTKIFGLMEDLRIQGMLQKEFTLRFILEEITKELEAERASLFLLDSKNQQLRSILALGVKESLSFDYRMGVAGSVVATGIPLNLNIQEEDQETRHYSKIGEELNFSTHSILCFPIVNKENKTIGVLEVINKYKNNIFTKEDEQKMKIFCFLFSFFYEEYSPWQQSDPEELETISVEKNLARLSMIGNSKQIVVLRKMIEKIKDSSTPLFLIGEKGVGKKLYARILHQEGNKKQGPFIVVDVLKKTSQASQEKALEKALLKCTGGVIYFNNPHYLTKQSWNRLFHALESKRWKETALSLDCRLIFSLEKEEYFSLKNKIFKDQKKEDLFMPLHFPSLRQRMEDFEEIFNHLNSNIAIEKKVTPKIFKLEVRKKLESYDWPENISELKRILGKIYLLNENVQEVRTFSWDEIEINLKPKKGIFIEDKTLDFLPLKDKVIFLETKLIEEEIRRCEGNKSKAAKNLGISREALRKKLLQNNKEVA